MAKAQKYDFGETSQNTTSNSTESKKSTDASAAVAPSDGAESIDNASETAEDTEKTEAKATEEKTEKAATSAASKKVLVEYCGNGVWKDAKGKCWSRIEKPAVDILASRSFEQNDYDRRDDLKFMVKYGEMKTRLV